AARLQPEDLFQDFEVMRNGEGVARILMTEEIEEIVEAGPCDGRKAQRARLMRGKEETVLRVWPFLLRHFVKPLQGMHLPMPERVFQLVVGLRQHQGEVAFL